MQFMRTVGGLALSVVFLTACKSADTEVLEDIGSDKDIVKDVPAASNPQALSVYSGEALNKVLENALLPDAESNLFTTPANIRIRSERHPEKVYDGASLFAIDRHGSGRGVDEFRIISIPDSTPPAYAGRVGFDVASAGFSASAGGGNAPTWWPGIYAAVSNGVAAKVAVVDYLPERSIRIQAFDVLDVNAPKKDWEVQLDGNWKGTQQVGNTLYIWSEYTVDPDKRYQLQRDKGSIAPPSAMAVKDFSMMPWLIVDGVGVLLTEDCLLPSSAGADVAYAHLINVTAINLDTKAINSTCLGGESNSFSVSSAAAYVTNSYMDPEGEGTRTVIHKFSLSESGLAYSTTGDVPGAFSTASKPHATETDLRLVTSTAGGAYQMYILDEVDGTLQVVSEALNTEYFESGFVANVRFYRDRAYIAVGVGSGGFNTDSFGEEDVIYSVDLADRTKPVFLTSMDASTDPDIFPLNNRYAFTLGFIYKVVDGQRRNYGIGVSVIDVENESIEPVSIPVGDEDIEPTGEDSYNIFYVSDDEVRVTFPSGYTSDDGEFIYGYQMLEINGLTTDEPAMVDAGLLVLKSLGANRSVSENTSLRGDDITIYNGGIWTAKWGQPDSVKGPVLRATLSGEVETEEESETESKTDDEVEVESEGDLESEPVLVELEL